MTDTAIVKTIFLKAAPVDVWAYLTDPDKLGIWFHQTQNPLWRWGTTRCMGPKAATN